MVSVWPKSDEASQFLGMMRFANVEDIDGYRRLLKENGCKVLTAIQYGNLLQGKRRLRGRGYPAESRIHIRIAAAMWFMSGLSRQAGLPSDRGGTLPRSVGVDECRKKVASSAEPGTRRKCVCRLFRDPRNRAVLPQPFFA